MVISLIGSLLCGLAPSMLFLIMARIIQGLGVVALGPVTIAFISNLFSLEERGKAIGVYAATQLLSNVAGPVLGGFVAHSFGWQWAFYMVIPVGLLSLLLISFFFHPSPHLAQHRSIKQLDVIGSLLLGISITLLIQSWTRMGQTGLDQITMLLFVLGPRQSAIS